MGNSLHWRTITSVLTTTVLAAALLGASAPPPEPTTPLSHSVFSAPAPRTSAPAAVQLASAPASSTVSVGSSASPGVAVTTSRSTAKTLRAPTPKISGAAAVGAKLTAKPGTWTSGTSLSYRWHADGKAISGGYRSTFTPTTTQQGKRITVQVTGKRTGYATASKTSAATLKVARSSTPKISGSATTGKTLSASVGTWTWATSFSYQWRANGTSIKGATSRTYKVATAHKGKRISVVVTGKKSGHTTLTRTSASTAAVKSPAPVKKPTRVTITSSTFNCPKGYPVKGNADSGIYHVPSGVFYSRTKPEECFATTSAARSAGYRASKR
ncbi:sunset domain-containing protein [Nesterenkonia sp. CF4.4]|uniref:sunset domain-containing protein n=1 Tax=Nesterenkonia sp. CF4.4 TaxID=3373079 RepID=UPI003EE6ADA8